MIDVIRREGGPGDIIETEYGRREVDFCLGRLSSLQGLDANRVGSRFLPGAAEGCRSLIPLGAPSTNGDRY